MFSGDSDIVRIGSLADDNTQSKSDSVLASVLNDPQAMCVLVAWSLGRQLCPAPPRLSHHTGHAGSREAL